MSEYKPPRKNTPEESDRIERAIDELIAAVEEAPSGPSSQQYTRVKVLASTGWFE